jgi:predicted metal-binding membrane protein
MNKAQKAVIASLIITSSIAWIASTQQPDMMAAMATYNPLAISLFTASWTAGMAAMMFPAITPMVLLYSRFVSNKEGEGRQSSIMVQEQSRPRPPPSILRSLRVIVFIGCYLLVWALTGIALLLGWSVVMNNTIITSSNTQLFPSIYGAILIIAGAYQFTPLKKTCIGYCESPISFFMRRWKDGTFGAVRMGLWHGLYCLGCCWAYFLLMVALGWMNLLWMGLFAGLIFGEKMWSRGIWVARAAGVGLAAAGILVILGMLPSLVSSPPS